jgi:hypothetical protein
MCSTECYKDSFTFSLMCIIQGIPILLASQFFPLPTSSVHAEWESRHVTWIRLLWPSSLIMHQHRLQVCTLRRMYDWRFSHCRLLRVQPVEGQPKFRCKMTPPSSGSKNKPSNKPDGGDVFLQNVGWLSTDYTALYSSRQYCSNWRIFMKPGTNST